MIGAEIVAQVSFLFYDGVFCRRSSNCANLLKNIFFSIRESFSSKQNNSVLSLHPNDYLEWESDISSSGHHLLGLNEFLSKFLLGDSHFKLFCCWGVG